MELSQLTLKIILILIPGGLATIILQKLTTYIKWESFKFVVHAILLGGISYLIADLIFYPFFTNEIENFWKNIATDSLSFWEIIRATAVSVIVGFFAAYMENQKWITRFARWKGISDKYGEENLYSYFLNRKDVTEVYVRDIANDLSFHGEVDSFSETDEISEISLRNVNIYRYEDSEFLYSMPKVFLSRPKNCIFIEVPI